MPARSGYATKQRALVMARLENSTDRYQTVDELFDALRREGLSIGRTTVYRTLEKLVDEGLVSKVASTRGGSAHYRLAGSDHEQGQLLCIECGRALPLDCDMLGEFAEHIRAHHGFAIDQHRTVLCGVCPDCQRTHGIDPKEAHHDCHCSHTC